MIVLNENKTKILTEYDLTKGELVVEKLRILNKFEKDEEGNNRLNEYYNDLLINSSKVDDNFVLEHDKMLNNKEIINSIEIYKPFSETKLLIDEYNARIVELKKLLSETDYRAIKYAEGEYTEEEYAPYKALRQSYRDEINHLEEEISKLED